METTVISTKGQVVLPKAVRDDYHWPAGQQLVIERKDDGVLLRPQQGVSLEELRKAFGNWKYNGPAKTIKEMDEGMALAIKERHDRGRY